MTIPVFEWKIWPQMEKILAASIFSFTHSVFESLLFQSYSNSDLHGKSLSDKKKRLFILRLFIWDVDEADNVKKSLILHFDTVRIKTSLVRQDFRRQKG